jgi:endonuclease/exonuclease/phosphatase family metal-dependent hydrolase
MDPAAGADNQRMGRFGLMTLNLRFGLAQDGPNDWIHRQGILPELFARLPMDFYCFQELNDFQVVFLKSVLADHRAIGQRCPAPTFWQNNLIFFHRRWRCLKADHFFLSPTPDIPSRFRLSRWPRQCTMGLFAADGRRIICITTHLDFSPDVQVQGVRLILERLSRWPNNIPVVMAGDFNAVPSSDCHRLLTDATAAAFCNVHRDPYPATHHGFNGPDGGDHIDWILYKNLVETDSYGVFQEKISERFASDHFPVWARWR